MILSSKRVPTEYDVEVGPHGIGTVLIDDRGRRFWGLTESAAFRHAEREQDTSDPIHHEPYPSPGDVPLSSWA